ncbi:MAG: flavodoxin family protein [Acidobacteriaceae bacterium]
MSQKVVAIVGSYRKGGTIDSAVQAILSAARENGAETHTLYLTDQHLEFCTNCRRCTQAPGLQRGCCVQQDDLQSILTEIDAADVLILGAPVNDWNVTAIFRQFMERLLGYCYWPWGQAAPRLRNKKLARKAVLISSSSMPGFCIPLLTGAARALRVTAKMLGIKPVASLWIGLRGKEPDQPLSPRTLARARRIGLTLA